LSNSFLWKYCNADGRRKKSRIQKEKEEGVFKKDIDEANEERQNNIVQTFQSLCTNEEMLYTFTTVGYGVDTDKIRWTTTKKSIVVISKTTGKATAKAAGTDFVVARTGNITIKTKVIVK